MDHLSWRSDRGLTRLESAIVMSVVIVGLLVGAGALIRDYTTTVRDTGQTSAEVASPLVLDLPDPPVFDLPGAPVTVAVPAAGTVAQPPGSAKATGKDACPDLRGKQPAGFDCTLPLIVPALDLSAVREKAPYQCADAENYRLVKGQTVQRDKKCILKTATVGRS